MGQGSFKANSGLLLHHYAGEAVKMEARRISGANLLEERSQPKAAAPLPLERCLQQTRRSTSSAPPDR